MDALAVAGLDEVLKLWSGLGYYARGRNLHAAARAVRANRGGRFPETFEGLVALPGIGRSTAGAILALAYGRRYPILDGNAKRVLARFHVVTGWPGETAVRDRLWALAERHTPSRRVGDYTQAIMDLGATLCTRTRPGCLLCPVADGCRARAAGDPTAYPAPRPKRPYPTREKLLLVMCDAGGRVLVERRPPSGIWGGLWSFPEASADLELGDAVAAAARRHGLRPGRARALAPVEHGFTHFRLRATPVVVSVGARAGPGGGRGGGALDRSRGCGPRKGWQRQERRWTRRRIGGGRPRGPRRRGTIPARRGGARKPMTRTVRCVKLGRDAPGFDAPPYPGELGQRIFESVSREAWQEWIRRQTMLINENRLSPRDPEARRFLERQMEAFLFGDAEALPEGYRPPPAE